jgi:hypothetical protein
MAIGDAVSDLQSIAAAAFLALQPAGTVEWIIHNVFHESDAELSQYDGTNTLTFSTEYGKGAWFGHFFHVKNTRYIRIKNVNTAAKLVGYDGVVTHT